MFIFECLHDTPKFLSEQSGNAVECVSTQNFRQRAAPHKKEASQRNLGCNYCSL